MPQCCMRCIYAKDLSETQISLGILYFYLPHLGKSKTQPEASCPVLTISSLALLNPWLVFSTLYPVSGLALGSWSHLSSPHLLRDVPQRDSWVFCCCREKLSLYFLALLPLRAPLWHHTGKLAL